MNLCNLERCHHYYKGGPNGARKCYYGEPHCWRGWIDMLKIILRRGK